MINELQGFFLISLFVHTGLIGMGVFNLNHVKTEKPFEVEFEVEEVLPQQYEVRKEKKIEKPIVEEVAEQVPEKKNELEKSDEEFKKSLLRYQDSIKQKIQEEKQYPRWALRTNHEGRARVVFNVLSSGCIANLRLMQPSGFEELDKEALDAIKRASPFLSFPVELSKDKIRIELDIVFLIKN